MHARKVNFDTSHGIVLPLYLCSSYVHATSQPITLLCQWHTNYVVRPATLAQGLSSAVAKEVEVASHVAYTSYLATLLLV